MNTQFQVVLSSFGFKYGLPAEATTVWDVRFLPNPYWLEAMRLKNGRDPEVAAYVLESPAAIEFLRLIEPLLLFLVCENKASGKQDLHLAVGCTGGQHRSVAVVESLKALLAGRGVVVQVVHRDIERDSPARGDLV